MSLPQPPGNPRPPSRPLWTRLRHGRAGAVGGSSLLQLAVVLVVLGVVVFEVLALGVTAFQVDDRARKVAAAAADAYATAETDQRARTAAEETAASLDVRLVAMEVHEDERDVLVEVRRRAPTLVAHRLMPERTVLTATASAGWG